MLALLPRAVRRRIMHAQVERLVTLAVLFQELQRALGDDVGQVAIRDRHDAIAQDRCAIVVTAPIGNDAPVAEALLRLQAVAEMPLAGKPANIPVFSQDLRVGGQASQVLDRAGVIHERLGALRRRQIARTDPVVDAVLGRRHAGQDRCASGRANGRSTEKVGKVDALFRQPVQIRRQHLLIAGGAQRPSALVVGQDKDDIRAPVIQSAPPRP